MDHRTRPLRVWLVDPISYSGMAYSDVGQIDALRQLGADPLLVGSDSWFLPFGIVPHAALFRGTHGPWPRWRRGVAYIVSLGRLVRRIAAVRPDVVHWQYIEVPVADLLAMLTIRLLGVPQVYTAHELLPWTARVHHRLIFRAIYRIAERIVIHNDRQRTTLIRQFGVPPSRAIVAALGGHALFATPQLPQGQARRHVGVPEHAPVALFFGAIRPSKGLDILLDAWPRVVRRVADARLLVVGKPVMGVGGDAIRAQIAALGLADVVDVVLEQVTADIANAYYRAADIVVLPYREIGSSGVLRYAYDSARSVVATTVGEHVDRVVEGTTGFLVPPDDPGALADAITTALLDRNRSSAMGVSALAYARAHFAWIDSARILMATYADLHR